jgi:hypothetical protein
MERWNQIGGLGWKEGGGGGGGGGEVEERSKVLVGTVIEMGTCGGYTYLGGGAGWREKKIGRERDGKVRS